MRDDLKRQLLALGTSVWIALEVGLAGADDQKAITVGKLQEVKMLEATLRTRETNEADWRRLNRIYHDLTLQFPTDAQIRNAHAESLWERNLRERAINEWEAAERLDPKNAKILDRLADAWMVLGNVKKSARYAGLAVASEPENPSHHFLLANVTFLFRHELVEADYPDSEAVLQRALTHFAEASRLAPLNVEYARAYAETFYNLAKPDWTTALAAWQRFTDLSPQKDFGFANLARVHIKLGQKDAARESLVKVQSPGFQKLKKRLEDQINQLPQLQSPRQAASPPER